MNKDKKPLVVFVFSEEGSETSTKYGGFVKRLKKAGGLESVDTLTVALENLIFVVSEDGAADVIDSVSGQSMSAASLVYMKSRWGLPEEASTLATYLFHKGIPFMDTSAMGTVMSKIATTFRLWGNGVAVPFTLYARRHDVMLQSIEKYASQLGEKFILKDAKGAKGKTNFLVTLDEAKGVLKEYSDVQFVAQRFIPNAGDFRVGVYSGVSSFVIKRVGSGDTHLNNTSAGGVATYLETSSIPAKMRAFAEKAARAVGLQVAGVDIIVDAETQKQFILEVNQGSQIVTGAYAEQNMKAFNEAIISAARNRHARDRRLPAKVIGRRATAKLKDLGIKQVVAKIDTGAYSSTLHAENIRVETIDGQEVLKFEVVPSDFLRTLEGKTHTVETHDFFVQKVRSSNGQLQERYSVRTRMTIEGRTFSAALTLSDRSEMGYPLLIGRRLIRSRFIVNVELNEDNLAVWSY